MSPTAVGPAGSPPAAGKALARGAVPAGFGGPGVGRIGRSCCSGFVKPGNRGLAVALQPLFTVLRTVEAIFSLPPLGYAAEAGSARFGADVFKRPPRRLHRSMSSVASIFLTNGEKTRAAARTDFPAEAARLAAGERDPGRVDELRYSRPLNDIGQRNPLLLRAEAHRNAVAFVEHFIGEIEHQLAHDGVADDQTGAAAR